MWIVDEDKMVEKEIKKKTSIYGTVAVLSAIILVSLIFIFGTPNLILPPSNTPTVSGLKTFQSYDELKNYLISNQANYPSYHNGPLDDAFFNQGPESRDFAMPSVPAQMATSGNAEGATPTYSATNIQVAGVDEADIVKTDGKYVYVVQNGYSQGNLIYDADSSTVQNHVYIINADPQNAKVVAKISFDNNTYLAGIFLSQDSNKLAVLASQYHVYTYDEWKAQQNALLYRSDVYTFINVYDISNKVTPVLARNFTVSGSYFNSRMIGDYVYAVVSQSAYVQKDALQLPTVYAKKDISQVEPTTVYYSDQADYSKISGNYFTYNTFIGLNIRDDSQTPTNMTVLMGGASTMYVSQNNMYVTYPTWEDGQYTSIYRINIDGSQLTFEAKGNVPGYLLNQYSMDEYNNNFRVATNWEKESKMNNVYVLNMSMGIVGKLEGLAVNENLHSVRFMGDKVYLVTFKKVDPLFVIDVSQPANPKVLGQLKIPGYSDYLHPYDEQHLIGVGKETVEADQGDFAFYQGLKLSLFDVSNVNNPVQLAKYVIGDRGTDSLALSEPKAFLFDKEKGLLVIPVNLAVIDVPENQRSSWTYGKQVSQGAYVFDINLDGGFTLKGTITHINQTTSTQSYWQTQQYWVTRSLYIDNTLITVSNAKLKLNSLTNLAEIATVNLD